MSSKVTTKALHVLILAFAGHPHGEIALRTLTSQRDLIGDETLSLFLRPLEHRGELRHGLGERLTDEIGLLHLQQRLGRAIDQSDDTVTVDADDTGGHARQHRLHELAALVELRIGADQLVTLTLELRGHRVESRAEHREVAIGGANIDIDAEVAARNLLGRTHELADRRDQTIGEPHADPDGRREERQCQRQDT